MHKSKKVRNTSPLHIGGGGLTQGQVQRLEAQQHEVQNEVSEMMPGEERGEGALPKNDEQNQPQDPRSGLEANVPQDPVARGTPTPSVASTAASGAHSARMNHSKKMLRKASPRQRHHSDEKGSWRFFDASFQKLEPMTQTNSLMPSTPGSTTVLPKLDTPRGADLALHSILENRTQTLVLDGGKEKDGAQSARVPSSSSNRVGSSRAGNGSSTARTWSQQQQDRRAQRQASPRLAPVPAPQRYPATVQRPQRSGGDSHPSDGTATKLKGGGEGVAESRSILNTSPGAVSERTFERCASGSAVPSSTPVLCSSSASSAPVAQTLPARLVPIPEPPQMSLTQFSAPPSAGRSELESRSTLPPSRAVKPLVGLAPASSIKGYADLRHSPPLLEGYKLRPLETNLETVPSTEQLLAFANAEKLDLQRVATAGTANSESTQQRKLSLSQSYVASEAASPIVATSESLGQTFDDLAINQAPSNLDWADAVASTPYTGLQKLVGNATSMFLAMAPLLNHEELPAEDDLEVRIGLRRLNRSLHPMTEVKLGSDVPVSVTRSVVLANDRQRTAVNLQHDSSNTAPSGAAGTKDFDFRPLDRSGGLLHNKDLPKDREQRLAYLRARQREAEEYFGFRPATFAFPGQKRDENALANSLSGRMSPSPQTPPNSIRASSPARHLQPAVL